MVGKMYNRVKMDLLESLDELKQKELAILQADFLKNHEKNIVYWARDANGVTKSDIPQLSLPNVKGVDLYWIDPWYQMNHQPTTDAQQMYWRSFFDSTSKEGSTILIWGRYQMLCEYWKPIFAFNHKQPKGAHWTIDPQLFVVLRSEKYDKFTHNNKSFHSLTESVIDLIVLRLKSRKEKP